MKPLPALLAASGLLLLSGCASPPVRLYTIDAPSGAADTAALPPSAPVIALDRVSLPDYLDNQDILLRDGAQLDRSPNGRWASRLSDGATGLLRDTLTRRWPGVLVTDHPEGGTPAARLSVNVTRLDVTRAGDGTLEADWALIPADERRPVLRQRARFTAQGDVSTDGGVAALTRDLLGRLDERIAVTTSPR